MSELPTEVQKLQDDERALVVVDSQGFIVEEKARGMERGLEAAAERPDGSLVDVNVWLEPIRADGKLYAVADVKAREAAAG